MGLSFLAPLLLGGMALVAVPVVLHMMMRQKPVKRDFPALRFLQARVLANRRRLRLNHLLLLLARMAALAVLALAMARPVLRNAGWLADAEGPVAAVLVFDTAPRMELREANRTRLEQSVGLAQKLFDKLPATSKVAILDTAGSPVAFLPTMAAAAARISRLATATPATSLATAVSEGLRLLETSDLARRELYVFTDCSRGAMASMTPLAEGDVPADTTLLWIDVGATAAANCGIDALDLSTERLPAGTPLVVTAATSRSGPAITRSVAVEMLDANGGYVRRAEKPTVWKPDTTGEVSFEIAGLAPGTQQGRVVIVGSDDLPADDVRTFTVDVGAPARVLVAAAAPADRTGLFVAQAIAPAVLQKTGRARFEAQFVDAEKLDAATWDGYDAIELVDPPPLADSSWDQLREWVATGHGLVVWLGPRAGAAERFNTEAGRQLLGGGLVRVWRTPGDVNYLAPAALDHPLLAAFRRVGDAVPWQDFPVERHWEFAPNEQERAATTVVSYRNGLPAILEHRVGEGTVIVVTTPVSQAADDPDAWNTLATGFEPWPFVILANEMLLYAIDNADNRNITAGETAVVHVARGDINSVFVRTPAGDEVPVAVDPRRGTVTVTDTRVAGNYVLRSGGQVGGFAKGFSANLPAAAIDFTRLDPEPLAAVLGLGHRLARTEADLARDVALGRIGAELFGWLILVAACAMALDWILANRFYAPLDDQAVRQADKNAGATNVAKPTPPPLPVEATVSEEVPA